MGLFRQSALQKILSPEQLNQLIRITKPRDWLALLAVCIILLAIIIWGIWGEIPTEFPGDGIIVRAGGLRTIYATQAGILSGLTQFKLGDEIQTSQTIAQVTPTQQNLVTKISSPFSGSVVETAINNGSYVSVGTPIITLEDSKKILQALIFLSPTTDIDKIKPGMQVKIFLGLEKRAALGYLIGKVTALSKFPATHQGIISILHNEELVQLFLKNGPPYIVYVDMIPDPHTASGYKWSSATGATINVHSGMLCTAMIIVARQAPINLVIPSLK